MYISIDHSIRTGKATGQYQGITAYELFPRTWWIIFGEGRCLWGSDANAQLGKETNSGLPNISGHLSGAGNLGLFDTQANDHGDNLFTPEMYNCDRVATLWVTPHDSQTISFSGRDPILLQKSNSANSDLTVSLKTRNTDDAENVEFNDLKFDASKANSIYGSSNIVQPPAVGVVFYRRVS